MNPELTSVCELRVKLYVPDFNRRRAFYSEVIGWPVATEWNRGPEQRGVMFDTGCGILELLHQQHAEPPSTSCDVSLMVPDVWRLWEDLRSNVAIVFPLRDNPWGDSSFCISDPGGFRLTFFSATNAVEQAVT
jgi:predicted enzyme related to lactoylglutathione lyase